MTPDRKRVYEQIETSRQIADRLDRNSGRLNRSIPDDVRIQAMRDVLTKIDRVTDLSDNRAGTTEDRMVEARVRSIAVEAVAWLEAITERRATAGRPDDERPNLRAVS